MNHIPCDYFLGFVDLFWERLGGVKRFVSPQGIVCGELFLGHEDVPLLGLAFDREPHLVSSARSSYESLNSIYTSLGPLNMFFTTILPTLPI
jgi:hypothetical protein